MPGVETRFAVLLFSDIVGSTDLKARHGVPAFTAALRVHNGHFERIARECRGVRILQNMGDGYFAEGDSVAEVVKFALLFQDAMRAGPWGEVLLTTRVGIHAGEISAVESEGGSGIVAPAADLAARVMSLALGGQILLTRFPFDEARHFLREHPPVAGKTMPPLRWLAHGPYMMKGRDEPLDIFEVGPDGLAPLIPPPDGEKAKRHIRPGEEETLGWRPAVGLEIPGRTGWHLTERLGAGGFGEVWSGEHAKLRQRRAFKFCFDDERLRALKREVTLVRLLRTALGDRDDIVRFHELKLDAPPFYLESDLAPHGNLLQWAERAGGLGKIPLARRIALVAHTATALAAAHSIGVLHKDIKPTNILIFDAPEGGVRPRLVDFGIGTLADPGVLAQHGVTGAGFTRATIQHSTGTPTYSPPEYLAGKPYTIQGDIYGLGVLLYQLITLKPLEAVAPGWERDVPDPLLREDIAACVDGDPARRLPSAADLAQRLLHLDQRRAEIVEKERLARESAARAEAEAAALADRVRVARLRKLAAAFAILALLAIVGGVVAWNQRQLADAAATQARESLSQSDFLQALRSIDENRNYDALAQLARSLSVNPRNDAAVCRLTTLLIYHDFALPFSRMNNGKEIISAQFSPDGKRIVAGSYDNTARVWDAQNGQPLTEPMKHEGQVESAQFSPDGKRIVTASYDNTARVWDAQNGQPLTEPMKHEGQVESAQFSPDGKRIVTTTGDAARVWDAQSGQPLTGPIKHDGSIQSVQFSPDNKWIVTAAGDERAGTARVWNVQSGQPLTEPMKHDGYVRSAHFSPDGKRIVTLSDDMTRVWDAESGQPLTEPMKHEGMVVSAQFSPDRKRIVTSSDDDSARVCDSQSGQSLTAPMKHKGMVQSAQFSPDGKRIVTAARDERGGTARVWDAQSGEPLTEPVKHLAKFYPAQFSPDGKWIVTRWDDGPQVWDVRSGAALSEPLPHGGGVDSAEFSPDGKRIVTASWDKTARVWDAQSGLPLTGPLQHTGSVYSAQFSSDGKRIVTASNDKTARVWDVQSGKQLTEPLQHDEGVHSAQFSPDGKRIVTASRDERGGTARVWDAQSGKLLAEPLQHADGVNSARFSPDGKWIVTASGETARIWDAQSGQPLTEPLKPAEWLYSAQFSPDGKRIVTGSGQGHFGDARVWDAQSGKLLTSMLFGYEEKVWSAQFSPDGKRIVTASMDNTARVWDAQSGQPLTEPLKHTGSVYSAQFSPDGKWVVTTSDDNTARVWDAQSGQPLTGPLKHGGGVDSAEFIEDGKRSAQFSPDGKRIVSASGDNTARVWDISGRGPAPAWLPRLAEAVAGQHLNDRGVFEQLNEDQGRVLEEIRAQLNRAPADDDWAIFGRWFLADRSTRTISPFSKITVPEYIGNRIKENTPSSLDEAARLAAGNAELLQRIAQAKEAKALLESNEKPGATPDKTIMVLPALNQWSAGKAEDARKVYNELMKLPRKQNESFESFTATLGLSEKQTAQFAAIGAAIAAESEDRMPKAFRYYYKDEADIAETGYLIWTRTGNAWEEKHPSGKDKRFQTAGRDIVEGRPGTVVHWVDEPSLTVFISDKNTDQPRVYYHYGDNEWTLLGPMEDVQ